MDDNLARTAKQLQRHYDTLITGDIHPVDHPVAKGDAREHGWRELLRRFFPDRYGVKSGFIIDASGNLSEQIDCIIYRKDTGIELYSVGHHTVIPAEATFGAFEIKPIINKRTLDYAEKKATSISGLSLSNNLVWNSITGEPEGYLKKTPVGDSIVLGLLADRIESKRKWEISPFKELMKEPNTKLSIFMTVEDGCADTLSTGYPTEEYTFYPGDHAILNQLIQIAESIAILESRRCLNSCCLTQYKKGLIKPRKVKIS
jgi:hypothetical protein